MPRGHSAQILFQSHFRSIRSEWKSQNKLPKTDRTGNTGSMYNFIEQVSINKIEFYSHVPYQKSEFLVDYVHSFYHVVSITEFPSRQCVGVTIHGSEN